MLPQTIMPQNITECTQEKCRILKGFLDNIPLQLLLHIMQSSIGKLMGQYDYHQLECHQSINPGTLYMEH